MTKTAILLILLFSEVLWANEVESILKKVESRDQGKDFISQFTMTIATGNDKKIRQFNWWANREGSGDYSLIKYTAPQNLRNSGLLVQSESSGSSSQWIYLSQAAKKEPRRVASHDKGKSFMGSDYFYIDFERFRTKDFNASLLKKEKWKTFQVALIKLIPKDKNYPYKEMTTRIDMNSYVPVQTELISRSGEKRIYEAETLEKIQGIWTIMKSSMTNPEGKSRSTLEAVQVKYNQGIEKTFFNQSSLKLSM